MFTFKSWLGAPLLLGLSHFLSNPHFVNADNPIIQTFYTADPSPIVYNDRVYIFTGHDEDAATNWYDMRDWRLFSSADMVNWQHHAPPMSLQTFPWATEDAWAGQVIARNGKFYYYVPIGNGTWPSFAIGVGVSDTITGPYVDAIGGPLLQNGGIDPTVYIDDNGQAYMYWGNPVLYYVKLNSDMISYSGGIQTVTLDNAGFGNRGNGQTTYQEGPWFYKRNGLYYMVYAAICCPENIQYSTSPNPTGPWTWRGVAMATGPALIDTNHIGITNFKGVDYFFYHNAGLPGGGTFHRSVCLESFTYTSNGSIPLIPMTSKGPAQIGSLNPYVKTEAATIAFSVGVKTEIRNNDVVVAYINNGDYIKVAGVAFGTTGAKTFTASVASATSGGNITMRINSLTGPVIGNCVVTTTGDWGTFKNVVCPITAAVGTHDLFFNFIGVGTGYLFNIDWWQFA